METKLNEKRFDTSTMLSTGKLTTKQLGVIDDLFAGELDEQAILAKHKIRSSVYNLWLAQEEFEAELRRRIRMARLMGEVLVARFSVVAAAKLVQLTESEKEETARKACLDIMSLPGLAKPPLEDEKPAGQISDETAAKILSVLADEQPDDCDP